MNINESAHITGEINDNHRYFTEYKHDEDPIEASKKLETKLKEINPHSTVIRTDPHHFVMVHEGGELITSAETTKNKHAVSTTYITPYARDVGLQTHKVHHGGKLYEGFKNYLVNSMLSENYDKKIYEIKYSYITKNTKKRIERKMHISHAIDKEHAIRIAHRIAIASGKRGFKIHV